MLSTILKWLTPKKYISNQSTAVFDICPIDRPVITISPSGYYGLYIMGVCAYINQHYDTSKYLFSGASAGAWMSLFMTLKGKPELLKDLMVKNDLYQHKGVTYLLQTIKDKILTTFTTDDFDLDRLCIGLTTFGQTNIYFDFNNLEDAIDCCLASSNIPFITGSLLHYYKNICAFDGNFSPSPYVDSDIILHIHPNMWGQNENINFNLYKKDYSDLEELYKRGYQDTFIYGKETLDKLFTNDIV